MTEPTVPLSHLFISCRFCDCLLFLRNNGRNKGMLDAIITIFSSTESQITYRQKSPEMVSIDKLLNRDC